MDTGAIAGTAAMTVQASTKEGISLMSLKQAADSQSQMANMLAKLARQPQPDPQFRLSVHA